jgi:hypothetical protein
MAEVAFIDALSSFVAAVPGLTPPPALIGPVAPITPGIHLPAIVFALTEVTRPGTGMGGGMEPLAGALPWQATIDLADPTLPDIPDFSLISPDRLSLILPHGGLVRNDGTEDPLAAVDFSLSVNGASRPLVAPPPTGDQISVDPVAGVVTFATALPAAGTVIAAYHIGQWERQVTMI